MTASAKYLLRFDDICPTMDWDVWGRIEKLLDSHGVRPLLAVVPDNRDPALQVQEARGDFWDKVRYWQSQGWSIGLHGHQHLYSSKSAGLVGLNSRSEFAGLPSADQARKLDAGMEVFRREGVRVDCWIAPGHSFDRHTVALLRERQVSVISDGYFRQPVRWMDCVWIPQQLWRFRPVPRGLWTVCYHHNGMSDGQLAGFAADLERHGHQIASLREIMAYDIRERSVVDSCWAALWLSALKVRRAFATVRP